MNRRANIKKLRQESAMLDCLLRARGAETLKILATRSDSASLLFF